MAKIILFSGKDCSVCEEADKKFKNKFKDEIADGEAEIIVLDDDEDAYEFWAENQLPLAPTICVISDAQKCLIVLDTDEILNEKSEPAKSETPQPVAAPVKNKVVAAH